MEQVKMKRHEVKMLNRKLLEITGIIGVKSFHSEAFLLDSECGHILIKGHDLHIKNLNLEQCFIIIEGIVDQFTYHEQATSKNFKKMMNKWFR